jgi:hypothetical protein
LVADYQNEFLANYQFDVLPKWKSKKNSPKKSKNLEKRGRKNFANKLATGKKLFDKKWLMEISFLN